MVTVFQIVKELIEEDFLYQEAILKGIVSYNKLANLLKIEVEKKYGTEVSKSAIGMAIRKYQDKFNTFNSIQKPEYKLFKGFQVSNDVSFFLLDRSQNIIKKIQNFFLR